MSSLALLALAPAFLFSQYAQAQACAPVSGVQLTYYGFPDGNSDSTSFGCSGTTKTPQTGNTAGGSGTSTDPFTFATKQGSTNFQECELVYVPYLKKYFRYMDHCTGCDDNHIDLWIGTDTSGGAAQITCEQDMGTQQGQTVIKNPGSNLEVVGMSLPFSALSIDSLADLMLSPKSLGRLLPQGCHNNLRQRGYFKPLLRRRQYR